MTTEKRTGIKTVPISELKIGDYQVWSRMSEDVFTRFTEDVRENGISDLLHVDENGVILDGHHRFEIAQLVGIETVEVKFHYGLSEEEKLAFAHKNNVLTREISRKEKIAKAIALRKEGRSERQIADWLGVGKSTVHRWLADVATGPSGAVAQVEGYDGKLRPSENTSETERQHRRENVSY